MKKSHSIAFPKTWSLQPLSLKCIGRLCRRQNHSLNIIHHIWPDVHVWMNPAVKHALRVNLNSDSHQWRLDALLWTRQLLILRAAALCRYTAFFIIAGSFASISAALMQSSKNPEHTHRLQEANVIIRPQTPHILQVHRFTTDLLSSNNFHINGQT